MVLTRRREGICTDKKRCGLLENHLWFIYVYIRMYFVIGNLVTRSILLIQFINRTVFESTFFEEVELPFHKSYDVYLHIKGIYEK